MAERSGDDIAVVTEPRFFFGHHAARYLLGDERVIARDLGRLLGPHEIRAAVADIRDGEVIADHRRGDHRRAHRAATFRR